MLKVTFLLYVLACSGRNIGGFVVEYWLLSFGVCFGDFEMTLDDEILGIFMEICDEILMVFTMYFLAPWFSVQGFELGFLDTSVQTIFFYAMFMLHVILYFVYQVSLLELVTYHA